MRYRLGPYTIDAENRIILHGDTVVRVPPKSVDLLLCLLEHHGGVAPKEALIGRLWPDTVVQESSLAQVVLALRRSLKESFGDREIIQTIPRRGYRLTVTVTVEEAVARHEAAAKQDALELERSAARHYPLIVVAGLVLAGLALALTWFR